jgi:glutamate-1-semialdehyde 2,1-aminomutase
MANIPASEGMLEEASAYTKVVPYNKPAELERAIEKNRNTACVIMEPVLANIGLVLPEKGYLNEVRKITEQNDIILIFDEVVTGFRLALGGAGKKEIMSKIAPAGTVYQASTFAGNPVSVAAGIATLETLIDAKNAIYPKIAKTCDSIVGGIKDMLTRAQLDCTVNSIGSMFQLFFTSERVKDEAGAKKANARMFRKLFDELLKQDVFIPPSQFETCFVSYAHTEDDTDKTVEAYGEAFHEIKK